MKELLTQAFVSKIAQQFEAIKCMAALYFFEKVPCVLIGKLRQIQQAFKSLNGGVRTQSLSRLRTCFCAKTASLA